MYLCHKCSGALTAAATEFQKSIRGCHCISGWVRDFQRPMTDEGCYRDIMDSTLRTVRWLRTRQASSDNKSIAHVINYTCRLEQIFKKVA